MADAPQERHDLSHSAPPIGEKRLICEQIRVIYRWWYDTLAILDDYSDAEDGVLPAGCIVTAAQFSPDAQSVLCDLENAQHLEKMQLPKGRVIRKCLCRPTPLQAEISLSDWLDKTKPIQ